MLNDFWKSFAGGEKNGPRFANIYFTREGKQVSARNTGGNTVDETISITVRLSLPAGNGKIALAFSLFSIIFVSLRPLYCETLWIPLSLLEERGEEKGLLPFDEKYSSSPREIFINSILLLREQYHSI